MSKGWLFVYERTIKSNIISSEGHFDQHLCLVTYGDHNKHALRDVEGMPPVVVGYGAVVLPHGKQPAAQHLSRKRKERCSIHTPYSTVAADPPVFQEPACSTVSDRSITQRSTLSTAYICKQHFTHPVSRVWRFAPSLIVIPSPHNQFWISARHQAPKTSAGRQWSWRRCPEKSH